MDNKKKNTAFWGNCADGYLLPDTFPFAFVRLFIFDRVPAIASEQKIVIRRPALVNSKSGIFFPDPPNLIAFFLQMPDD